MLAFGLASPFLVSRGWAMWNALTRWWWSVRLWLALWLVGKEYGVVQVMKYRNLWNRINCLTAFVWRSGMLNDGTMGTHARRVMKRQLPALGLLAGWASPRTHGTMESPSFDSIKHDDDYLADVSPGLGALLRVGEDCNAA